MNFRFIIPLMLMSLSAYSQKQQVNNRRGNNPEQKNSSILQTSRTISISVTEGTGMNIDISSDGKTLVFDLLGEIFTMPSSGGVATQLTKGIAVNTKPVWSPDSKYIAYLSDIDINANAFSTDNNSAWGEVLFLHVIDRKGNQVFKQESFEVISNFGSTETHWSPDGKSIWYGNYIYNLFDKNRTRLPQDFTTDHRKLRLITRGYSSDGNFLIMENKGDGVILMVDKTNWNVSYYSIPRREQEKSENVNLRMSPDKQKVVFMSTVKASENSQDRKIENLISYDLEAKTFNTLVKLDINYPGLAMNQKFCFSNDSRFIYIGYGGKLHRISLNTTTDEVIPFTAEVRIETRPFNYNQFKISNDSIRVNYLRSVQMRPDGKQLIFTALGKIFALNLPKGKPYILCEQPFFQLHPSYSADGNWIVYVSLMDTVKRGDIWRVASDGGIPEKLSKESGCYRYPKFNTSAEKIYFNWSSQGFAYGRGSQLRELTVASGCVREIADSVNQNFACTIAHNGKSIFYSNEYNLFLASSALNSVTYKKFPLLNVLTRVSIESEDLPETLIAVRRNYKIDKQSAGVNMSPTGKFIIYELNGALYLVPTNLAADKPTIIYDPLNRTNAIRFAVAGVDPHWEDGGKVISWVFGQSYYRAQLDDILSGKSDFNQKAAIEKYDWYSDISLKNIEPFSIRITEPVLKGQGLIALCNARLITMNGQEVLEKGTVLVKNGRILKVGNAKRVEIPDEARKIDCSGKTIMPGLIDMHFHDKHMYKDDKEYFNQFPGYSSYLSYGVTTLRDPSGAYNIIGFNELINSGKIVGPRLFGAGEAVRDEYLINKASEAERVIFNHRNIGAVVIKEYKQVTRLQQLWLAKAAQNAGINITHEGSRELLFQIGMIKNGSTGIEHAPNWGDVYEDVIQLYSKSNIFLTPTLQISYSSAEASKHYYWKNFMQRVDERLLRFGNPSYLKGRMKNIPSTFDMENPRFVLESKVVARIRKAGGNILLGSHSEDPGVGVHFELWALQAGGISNHEALQSATILAAEGLGMQKDLGSLEPGKIADLLILDKNPLDDIHNSTTLRYVMKDGILYDGNTLEKLWPLEN